MLNDNDTGKLDEIVKQTLSNYEAPYNANDWNQMEQMLDKAPKSGSFNRVYLLAGCVGLAMLTGGYLLYNYLHHKQVTPDRTTIAVPPPAIQNTTAPVTINPPLPINEKVSAVPTDSHTPPPAIESNKDKVTTTKEVALKLIEKEVAVKEKKTKKEPVLKETSKKKKKENATDENQQIFKMRNEPIFGDIPDSAGGITTGAKEQTKKTVKSQDYSIGWNSILKNVNPDSIKKHRMQQQKDSLPTPK